MSESTGCGSIYEEDDFLDPPTIAPHSPTVSSALPDDRQQFAPNIDYRYLIIIFIFFCYYTPKKGRKIYIT